MDREARLWEAICEAATEVVPGDAGPFVVGDHISVAEVLVEDGVGLAILTPKMTSHHFVLLARAIEQAAASLIEPPHQTAEGKGDADAT